MPLAFESISHGTVAFGFFNIEVDLMLLDTHLFGAEEFCGHVIALANATGGPPLRVDWKAFNIDSPGAMGNLHGAIAGTDLRGFLGEVYRLFPFPKRISGFKQKAYGAENRAVILPILEKYGRRVDFPVSVGAGLDVSFGPYRFDRIVFLQLIDYVLAGGYPRWDNETPPDYVTRMKARIDTSDSEIFRDML